MFDQARRRPTLSERFGLLVVIFVALLSLVAPAVALVDSERANAGWPVLAEQATVSVATESVAVACECDDLVVRVRARAINQVSPRESL